MNKQYPTDCHFDKTCCFRDRFDRCKILTAAIDENCGFAKPHRDARPYRLPPRKKTYVAVDSWPYG